MKHLYLFVLLFCSLASWGQTDTLTVYNFTLYPADNKSYLFTIEQDTVTDADTLFLDGDTILTVRDTGVFLFPLDFSQSLSGMMTVQTDSIVDAIQGDITFKLYQSACETCPYYAVTGATAAHSSPPDDSNVFFQVRGLRLKLIYYAVGTGTSKINTTLILKPSAISNNASN